MKIAAAQIASLTGDLPGNVARHALLVEQAAAHRVEMIVFPELSVPQHAASAHAEGASIYITSVAKTHNGVIKAPERLTDIARQYGMTVFMANCIGPCADTVGGGQSGVWSAGGEHLTGLNDSQEGLVIYDPAEPSSATIIEC